VHTTIPLPLHICHFQFLELLCSRSQSNLHRRPTCKAESFARYSGTGTQSWLLHWQLAVKYFHSGFRCTFPQTIAESTASFSSSCLMGWAISVESSVGGGNHFYKYFPQEPRVLNVLNEYQTFFLPVRAILLLIS